MLLFVLLGCAPPPLPAEDTAVVDTTPSIAITWPLPESEVSGCQIVTVQVENFNLVEFPGDEVITGEGHYHILHPAGYSACYAPYCEIDLSEVTETTEPYLTAVLAYTDHSDVLDEDGQRIEHQIPITFVPGTCATGGGDTGGMDSGY